MFSGSGGFMGGLGFLTGLSRVSIRVAYLSWSITGPYCSARKHITELGSFDGAQGVSRFRGARKHCRVYVDTQTRCL